MNNITTNNLRRMKDSEGLILQGCGGDLNEWVDGVNEMLTEEGILLDGTKFDADKVGTFQNEGVTNLLFPFTDDVHLNMGKFAMWRLQTQSQFAGKWLSDYVDNRLNGFVDGSAEEQKTERVKPDCPLIGADGNVFGLVGIAARTLRENGMRDEAKEMSERVFASHSYDDALCIIGEYVNITSTAEEPCEDDSEDDYYGEEDCDEDEDEGMGEYE